MGLAEGGELKAGCFAGIEKRVQTIKEDARKMAGDDSYQIDIGVLKNKRKKSANDD